jgi:hypothetical protein
MTPSVTLEISSQSTFTPLISSRCAAKARTDSSRAADGKNLPRQSPTTAALAFANDLRCA